MSYNNAMPKHSSKRLDISLLAKSIMEQATGQQPKEPVDKGKNPAAVALGRLGGLKGGKARAAKLTKEQRSEIAKKAAMKRWGYND
jgi:hypothetical protein